ncbi:hypothetical protein [Cetobacterium sp.]|uniref:hypothetical protein n=1 Tax=Cetobacterium sp. TaxID=2071632 RepID=UPI003EE71ED8
MGKEYDSNSKQIEKTKAAIQKYSETAGLTEKQLESYAKKLAEAKSKLQTLEKAQEENTKSVETARKVIVDYEKVLNKKSERLNAARAKMREYAKSIADTTKRAEEGKKKLEEWGKAALSSLDNIVKRAAQVTVAIAGVISAFAIKEGFGEAMNLEGYKMQLETATKSTEKAGQLMSNAIKYANSTPFETGQVVEATAKMEAMGASSERWLKDVADMAGATNKDIIQATEAMIDARKGEYERLKEFGLDKEQVMAKATEMYGKKALGKKVDENKKRILLENALQKLMQEKFAGGAEKQAKTLKGLWSTVTGVTKSSLAKIVGITDEGTIKQGSLYEKLKQQIEKVVNILNKWQEDGTIDAIAEKVTKAVEEMILFFSNLFDFIKEHRVLIETCLVFVGSIYMTIKALAVLKTVITAVSVVVGLLNGTIALTPLGWIVLGIAGVVTACYLLWQHLDSVINMFKSLFEWIKNLLDYFGPFGFLLAALTGPIGMVVAGVLGLIQHFDKLREAGEKVWGFVKKIFGAEDTEIKATTEQNTNSKITEEQIKSIKDSNPKGIGAKKLPDIKVNEKKSDPYFGEDKRFSQGKEASKKQETKIEVIIQGDVYGMDDFNEKVADAVVKMVEQNKANVVR